MMRVAHQQSGVAAAEGSLSARNAAPELHGDESPVPAGPGERPPPPKRSRQRETEASREFLCGNSKSFSAGWKVFRPHSGPDT